MAVVAPQLQRPAGDGIDGLEAVFTVYRRVVSVPFGDTIHLPSPCDVELDTSQFPH